MVDSQEYEVRPAGVYFGKRIEGILKDLIVFADRYRCGDTVAGRTRGQRGRPKLCSAVRENTYACWYKRLQAAPRGYRFLDGPRECHQFIQIQLVARKSGQLQSVPHLAPGCITATLAKV